MFMRRLKHALTKPQDLYISSDYKIVDTGLIAICIIFMQYLISVERPDGLQTIALVLFSIAIPFLAVHLFIVQTRNIPTLPAPEYLSKSFDAIFLIGSVCTSLGISVALAHSSWIVSTVFMASCAVVIWLYVFIFKDHTKAMKREIKKLEIENRRLELEREKLETELRNLELVRDIIMPDESIHP